MFLTQLIYDALLTLAYPQACAVCGGSVERRKFGIACEGCWKTTRVFTRTETLCWKCGVPAPVEVWNGARDEIRCRRCDTQSFTVARAAGLYEGALRESVLLLKRQPHLSEHVETLLAACGMLPPLNASTMIVPVPLHRERMRTRGFNQASIVADSLSRSLRLPVDEETLLRVSASGKYRAGLDAKGRYDTVAGAFAVRHPRLVQNEDILLVDDVFTTGATVSACAEALLAAGAKNVRVLTVARAINYDIF